MEIVQTNGSEFDQWGVAEKIWMIMYEFDLREMESCSYEEKKKQLKTGKLKK